MPSRQVPLNVRHAVRVVRSRPEILAAYLRDNLDDFDRFAAAVRTHLRRR